MELRGRPKENDIAPIKFTLETDETIYYFDRTIHKGGTVKVNVKPDGKPVEPEIIPNQKYGKAPVVVVFKTSNRSNAQTKMKIYKNRNIDWVLGSGKLPGIPEKAVWLETGVGSKFVDIWKEKYKLKEEKNED